MSYRGNLGCLWVLLAVLLIGGTPLLIGVARVMLAFFVITAVGGWIGSWWIRRQAIRYYTATQSERHNRFVELLVSLLVRLAELDGPINRREVGAIRQFFQRDLGYDDERLLWIRDLIKEARRESETVETLCHRIAANYALQERFIVLQVLLRVAQSDGPVSPRETRFIESIAALLGLGEFVRSFGHSESFAGGYGYRQARAQTGPSDVDKALGVLGLQRGASAQDIKHAWRRLSKENHPDRAAHLGEEFRKMAEQRMRGINGAYETLKEAGLAS